MDLSSLISVFPYKEMIISQLNSFDRLNSYYVEIKAPNTDYNLSIFDGDGVDMSEILQALIDGEESSHKNLLMQFFYGEHTFYSKHRLNVYPPSTQAQHDAFMKSVSNIPGFYINDASSLVFKEISVEIIAQIFDVVLNTLV